MESVDILCEKLFERRQWRLTGRHGRRKRDTAYHSDIGQEQKDDDDLQALSMIKTNEFDAVNKLFSPQQ